MMKSLRKKRKRYPNLQNRKSLRRRSYSQKSLKRKMISLGGSSVSAQTKNLRRKRQRKNDQYLRSRRRLRDLDHLNRRLLNQSSLKRRKMISLGGSLVSAQTKNLRRKRQRKSGQYLQNRKRPIYLAHLEKRLLNQSSLKRRRISLGGSSVSALTKNLKRKRQRKSVQHLLSRRRRIDLDHLNRKLLNQSSLKRRKMISPGGNSALDPMMNNLKRRKNRKRGQSLQSREILSLNSLLLQKRRSLSQRSQESQTKRTSHGGSLVSVKMRRLLRKRLRRKFLSMLKSKNQDKKPNSTLILRPRNRQLNPENKTKRRRKEIEWT